MARIKTKVLDNLKSTSRYKMEEAFNVIYEEYAYLVFYVAFKVVKNKTIAEDITNETFMRFFEHKNGIKKEKNLKYYLTSISKNLSLNYLKQSKNVETLDKDISYDMKVDQFKDYIEMFKPFLNEEEIDLLIYRFIYDFSFREIAEQKGVTTSVISSKYKRAIDKVKKHIKEI